MNGALNAVAAEVTYPSGVYATALNVDPVYSNVAAGPVDNTWHIDSLNITANNDEATAGAIGYLNTALATTTTTSVEAAIASILSGYTAADDLDAEVSIIRALAGVNVSSNTATPSATGAVVTINMNDAINAVAGEITYPDGVIVTDFTVDPTYTNDPTVNTWSIATLGLTPTVDNTTLTAVGISVDSAIANAISSGTGTANTTADTVSLIRALSNETTIGLE